MGSGSESGRGQRRDTLQGNGCHRGTFGNYPVNIGILSTPIIDLENGTIYVVAATLENGAKVMRLHALSILRVRSGQEARWRSEPVTLSAAPG